jgi:hypothetical protein
MPATFASLLSFVYPHFLYLKVTYEEPRQPRRSHHKQRNNFPDQPRTMRRCQTLSTGQSGSKYGMLRSFLPCSSTNCVMSSLSDAGSSRHHRPAAEAVDPDGVFDHPLLRQKHMRYYIMQGLFDAAFPVFHLTIELCRLPSHTTTAKNGIRVYDCPHLNATAE